MSRGVSIKGALFVFIEEDEDMTIGAIICCAVWGIAVTVGALALFITSESATAKMLTIVIAVFAIVTPIAYSVWYYNNTASGARALTDQRSNLDNGLEREINVYTADGNLIAHYEGKIDLEDNAGGYVIFDWNGKRYTYYNCFVESIAEIE